MYPPFFAEALRKRSHDVVSVHDRDERRGKADPIIFAAAQAESRVVVTNNARDFVPLVAEAARGGERHHGLILTSDRTLRRTRGQTEAFVELLGGLMEANPGDAALRDQVRWLTRPT